MKQMKTLVIAVALIFGATSFATAQSKVAHINAQELVETMPEFKAAQSQLEKLETTYDTEFKTLMTEAQTTMQRYDKEAPTKTDEENAKRMAEMQEVNRSINQYRQNAVQEIGKKRADLIKPIMDKASTTIQKVAKEKGYDYVLDSSTGAGVLMAEGYDLMADVKKAMGI